MEILKINIINKSKNPLPEYQTIYSAGVDLRAFCDEDIEIKTLERKLISTGIFIELPIGYEAQIRPRSGLALKNGLTVLNSPGTIDSDYRGEVKILMINLSQDNQIIKNGDRIAQMIVTKHSQAEFIQVNELSTTERGQGGYGHTGIK